MSESLPHGDTTETYGDIHCPWCGKLPRQRLDYQTPRVNCKTSSCPLFEVAMTVEMWANRAPHENLVKRIPIDEPIFVLRAQDKFAPNAIMRWQLACIEHNIHNLEKGWIFVSEEKRRTAADHFQEICDWQRNNPTRVKIPD